MRKLLNGLLLSTLSILLLSTQGYAKETKIAAGMWEWTISFKPQGIPITLPASVTSSCISMKNLIPHQPGECTMLKHIISGNNIQWKMACNDNKLISEGAMDYTGTTSIGEGIITQQDTVVTSIIIGRRIGSCK